MTLGAVTRLQDLVPIFRERRIALGVKQRVLDDEAGLQPGYTGKLECGVRGVGVASIDALLAGLGLELQVHLAASKVRDLPRETPPHLQERSLQHRRAIAAKGGRARFYALSPLKRRRIAKKASMAAAAKRKRQAAARRARGEAREQG